MSSQTLVTINIGTYSLSGAIMDCSKVRQKLISRVVVPSFGINCGVIKDVRSFSKSIFQLVTKLENNSNQPIKKVNLSISGASIRSFYILKQFSIDTSGSEITKEDIRFFISECLRGFYKPDVEILDYYPIQFILDDKVVEKPVGMIGDKLMIRLHIIGCDKSSLDNLVHTLSQSHLAIEKILPSVLVSGYGFLSPEEMKNGTLVIDLGESTTTIGFFLDGSLIYIKTINIGTYLITENIFNELGLSSMEDAKILQTKHAKALDINMGLNGNDELIYINQNQVINSSELSEIVHISLNRIFTEVLQDIDDNLMRSMIQRVYVIGGGANIMYINQYVADISNLNVKEIVFDTKAILREIPPQDLLAFLPHYGFVKYLMDHEKDGNASPDKKSNGLFAKIKNFFTDN